MQLSKLRHGNHHQSNIHTDQHVTIHDIAITAQKSNYYSPTIDFMVLRGMIEVTYINIKASVCTYSE